MTAPQSPVIALTPGRCSQCGRFVAKGAEPEVWEVDVHPEYQQAPGEPNIWARTRCAECRMTRHGVSWLRPSSMDAAVERARLLGQEVTP